MKQLLLILVLSGVMAAQAPTCPSLQTPADANTCAAALLIWASNAAASQNSIAQGILAKQISDVNATMTQLLKDDSAGQAVIAQLKSQIAPLAALTIGPVLSAPTATSGVGTATIAFTSYVSGQGVIVWGIATGATINTIIPTGTNNFSATIAKPSGTTIYYRLKLNFDGYQLISPEYTVKVL
jgi:hypothetical protein